MTLLADYQNRISTQQRTEWSNPQNSGAGSPNTSQETLAAADASAAFQAICGVAYDSTVALHVTAGVPLVIETLKLYTGQTTQELYQKVLDRMQNYWRLVLGRNRAAPTTDSPLVPTAETFGAQPMADLSIFRRYVGNAPGGGVGPTNDPARTTQKD